MKFEYKAAKSRDIEVRGVTYTVKARTPALQEQLITNEKELSSDEYALIKRNIELLCGADAVGAIYPERDTANLDELYALYAAVVSIFFAQAGKSLQTVRKMFTQ